MAITREALDAIVEVVGHEEVAVTIDRDSGRPQELAITSASTTHGADDGAIGRKDLHPIVTEVGHINASTRDRNSERRAQITAASTGAAPGSERRAIGAELLHPTIQLVDHIQRGAGSGDLR